MPQVGDIRKATDINYQRSHTTKYIWHACEGCGKERWVALLHRNPKHLRCVHCKPKGKASHLWVGGENKDAQGYIRVRIDPDDFFYPMAYKKERRVLEHRLVMAKHLNRCLLSWEIVHHKNGIKDDNRLENLILFPNRGSHNTHIEKQLRIQAEQIKQLQARVTLLEAENLKLNYQKELVR